MFDKILVAVDGSSQSSKTIATAVEVARRFEAGVTVLHVREHGRYDGSDVDLGPPTDAQALVDEVVARFSAAGIDASGEVRRVTPGSTPKEIVDVANEAGAGLIVIGTRGMTEWKSLMLGGVANKVVVHASCPVLLVR